MTQLNLPQVISGARGMIDAFNPPPPPAPVTPVGPASETAELENLLSLAERFFQMFSKFSGEFQQLRQVDNQKQGSANTMQTIDGDIPIGQPTTDPLKVYQMILGLLNQIPGEWKAEEMLTWARSNKATILPLIQQQLMS